MKKLTVHLISESSGQTVKNAANTALSQFSTIEVKKYHWPMTRNVDLLKEVFLKIDRKPGIILYTISNEELRNELKEYCFNKQLPCISVVGQIIEQIAEYIGTSADVDHRLNFDKFDQQYFDKMAAIDYSLRHDDGQSLDNIESADIVLIGPSRTSKTPTSVWLAYNGFKTANIPYIHNCPFPKFLPDVKKPVIFGLIINPSRLIEIRENRVNLLQAKEISNYTDIKIVQDECRYVRKLCNQNGWQVIDVSSRSIEETAAMIMKSYYIIKKKREAL
ncbi:MAG: kinase/pyrophosphorylase [Rickettsiaceae bacterium]|nr:kinase/pyrophosphorylase [Rickettsiaceae bacterium]